MEDYWCALRRVLFYFLLLDVADVFLVYMPTEMGALESLPSPVSSDELANP